MQFISFANRPITPTSLQYGLFLFDSGTDFQQIKTVDDWHKQVFNCFGLTMSATATRVTSGPVRSSSTPVGLHVIPRFYPGGTRDQWNKWSMFEETEAFGRGYSVSTSATITSGGTRYFLIPPTNTGKLQTGNFTTYKYEANGYVLAKCSSFASTNVNTLTTFPYKSEYGGSEFGNYRSVSGNFWHTCDSGYGVAQIGNFQFGPAAVTSVSAQSGPVNTVTISGTSSPGSSYCTWMGAMRATRKTIDNAPLGYEMLVLKRGEDYEDTQSTGAGASKIIDLNLIGILQQKFFLDAKTIKI